MRAIIHLFICLGVAATLKSAQASNDTGHDAVSIVCTQTRVTATVDPAKLVNLTITKISINGCPESDYNATSNSVTTLFDKCAYNITQDKDIITQETHMRVSVCENPYTIICRGSFLTYQLACKFDRRLNVSTAVGVNVTDKESFVFDKAAKTNFTAEMKFYDTSMFTTPSTPPLQVTAFQPLYIAVEALQNQNLFKFIVEDCYATPSANPLDSNKYLFFTDKCGIDSTYKTFASLNTATKYCYKIDAFRFIQLKTRVFFHCRLLICKKASSSKECTQACGSKRRRRAIEEGSIEEMYVNSGPVNYKQKPTCQTKTCPLNSRCYDLHPATCRCNDDYVLDRTTNTCKKVDGDSVFKANNLHLDETFLQPYGIPKSDEFIRLATHIEEELMTSYLVDRKFIQGVKVVSARSGSIILDVLVLHSKSMTTLEAFNYFVDVVIDLQSSVSGRLNIKQRYPTIAGSEPKNTPKKESMSLEVIIIVVAVSVIALTAIVVAVFFVTRRNRGGENKVTVQDNPAMSMDNISY